METQKPRCFLLRIVVVVMNIQSPEKLKELITYVIERCRTRLTRMYGVHFPTECEVILDVDAKDAFAVFGIQREKLVVYGSDDFMKLWQSLVLDLGRLSYEKLRQIGDVTLAEELRESLNNFGKYNPDALRKNVSITSFLPYAIAHKIIPAKVPDWYLFGVTWSFQFQMWKELADMDANIAQCYKTWVVFCKALFKAYAPELGLDTQIQELSKDGKWMSFHDDIHIIRTTTFEISSYYLMLSLINEFGEKVLRSVAKLPTKNVPTDLGCIKAISKSCGVDEDEIKQYLAQKHGFKWL